MSDSNRILLFADRNNQLRRRDSSLRKELFPVGGAPGDGLDYDGKWLSPSLNRQDPFKSYTLRKLLLFYNAEAGSTLDIAVSGDGGATFNETKTVSVAIGDGQRVAVGFNTTGPDVRFEIRLTEAEVINVYGYKARLVERSDVVLP